MTKQKNLSLCLQDTSEKLLAHTYVWSNTNDPKLYGEWDFEVNLSFPCNEQLEVHNIEQTLTASLEVNRRKGRDFGGVGGGCFLLVNNKLFCCGFRRAYPAL